MYGNQPAVKITVNYTIANRFMGNNERRYQPKWCVAMLRRVVLCRGVLRHDCRVMAMHDVETG